MRGVFIKYILTIIKRLAALHSTASHLSHSHTQIYLNGCTSSYRVVYKSYIQRCVSHLKDKDVLLMRDDIVNIKNNTQT